MDTDWIIDALHEHGPAIRTLESLAPAGLAVSLVTYAELYEGAFYARDSKQALAEVSTFLDAKDVIPATQVILERFAVIRGGLTRHLRNQDGDFDLVIAATALTHDLTLVTRNLRHVRHVAGLSIYDTDPPSSVPE